MMKRLFVVLVAWIALLNTPAAADDLATRFAAPPDSARPWVYWFWMSGNITREGITADLEALHRVGVGGVLIMNILQGGIPTGDVKFMTLEWRAAFSHAVKEADRLGLQVVMNNDDGWSGSGGPWIRPEQSMQQVVWTETRAQGPANLSVALPQPPTLWNYYRDAAVLAFPLPDGDETLMAEARPKITASETRKFDPEKITDRNATTFVSLPLPKPASPTYIQFEFARPYRARALNLTMLKRNVPLRLEVQASDDGKTFQSVGSYFAGWQIDSIQAGITLAFPEVSRRFFRIVFTGTYQRAKQLDVAEVEWLGGTRLHLWEGKAGHAQVPGHGGETKAFAEQAPVHASAGAVIRAAQVVDLTRRMDRTGRLEWNVPPGRWVILRIGHTTTGHENGPATDAGRGLECDKFSPAGIAAHFPQMMGRLLAESGPLAGKTLTATHIDSWELRNQTWSSSFRDEFLRRRGYDLFPYLPLIAGGRVVESAAVSERFLWDLRRTYADLIADNYYGQMQQLARASGIHFQAEGSGLQQFMYDPLAYQSRSELPMGEFWVGQSGGGVRVDCKVASSTAHLNALPIAAAEAFTSGPETARWQNDPFSLKALGDEAFCAGVNRFVIHRYPLQPWTNRWPGMTMGRWGIHFERTLTWWEQGAAYIRYLTRCQFLLQQGRFVADVCCLPGEGVPNYLGWRKELSLPLPEGYDYDGSSAEIIIDRMTVKDGRVALPSGMSYRLLLLPNSETMTPELLRKIKTLVYSGATVVGPKPQASPSLHNYPRSDAEVRQLANEVWGDCDGRTATSHSLGKGRVMWGQTFAEVFQDLGLRPDFEYRTNSEARLQFIHRKADAAEIYFVSNPEPQRVDARCTFRVSGKRPELWHPDSGQIVHPALYEEHDGRILLPLHFDPSGSLFVVFRTPALSPSVVAVKKDGQVILPPPQPSAAQTPTVAAAALQPFYRDLRDTFTLSLWVNPAAALELPQEQPQGVETPNAAQLVLQPQQGALAIGPGHAIAGVAVGSNGVYVLEHSARYRPAVLVCAQKLTGWTHLAVVYRNKQPHLYLNGKLARSGLTSSMVVHPSGQLGKGAAAFHGSIEDVRVLNAALSEQELADLCAPGRPGPSNPAPAARPIELTADKSGTVTATITATVAANGNYELRYAQGPSRSLAVRDIPKPLPVDGPWNLHFPPGWGAPECVVLDKLISWTNHAEAGVRYFSGTATYRKAIDLPPEMVRSGRLVALDLGAVKNLAQVKVNGKDLGVVWKPPFCVDVTAAVKPGRNALEISITNLWPNRLIGDEQEPDDMGWWSGVGGLKKWPDWFIKGQPRPSKGRYTFTTWQHYKKDSPLLPSGLLGPVTLQTSAQVTVK